jgi:hypothetical protein
MATQEERLAAARLLIAEGEARLRRSIESGEPADGTTGITLLQAAEILLADAQLEEQAHRAAAG